MASMMKHLATAPSAQENFARMCSLGGSDDVFADTCGQLTESLEAGRAFSRAETKLRSNKTRHKKKFRNLEGILAIQGELITEAANYDPLGGVLLLHIVFNLSFLPSKFSLFSHFSFVFDS
jgi:hypothetical protein